MQGEQRAEPGGEWEVCTGSGRVAVEADHEVLKGLHLEALRGAQAELRDVSS